MSARLAGKTAFITAAGQGIGRASALGMLDEGAIVWATDREAALLASLPPHAGLKTAALDVTDSAAVIALAERVGAVDVIFNCAGYVHHGTLLDCTPEDWARSFDINVTSMYRVTRALLPAMLANGGGSIINMASMASSVKGFPNRCVYGATKAAVIGLTKAIAADYVKRGVRCNAVCPGTVDTPSLRGRIAAAPDPAQAERDFIARQPMGRLATVDDIVPLVIYLAADESRYATGGTYSIDGGTSI